MTEYFDSRFDQEVEVLCQLYDALGWANVGISDHLGGIVLI